MAKKSIILWYVEVEGGLYFLTEKEAKKTAKWYRKELEEKSIKATCRTIVYTNVTQLVLDIFNHKIMR